MSTITLPSAPRIAGSARVVAQPMPARVSLDDTHVGPRVHPLAIVVAVVSLVVIVASAMTVFSAYRAASGVSADTAGHVMVEPGRSLWEVAVETAPAGVTPSEHYAALQDLNGHSTVRVDGWTVILLPSH